MITSAVLRDNPHQRVLVAILEAKSRLLDLLEICKRAEESLETTHKLDMAGEA
jgi:hypothetical protein